MRGKILTALAYPIVLAVVAVLVVTALMIFVVPQGGRAVRQRRAAIAAADPDRDRHFVGAVALLVGWR
jgi:general secretion pathway protein F